MRVDRDTIRHRKMGQPNIEFSDDVRKLACFAGIGIENRISLHAICLPDLELRFTALKKGLAIEAIVGARTALDKIVAGQLVEAEHVIVVKLYASRVLNWKAGYISSGRLGDNLSDGLDEVGPAAVTFGEEGPAPIESHVRDGTCIDMATCRHCWI